MANSAHNKWGHKTGVAEIPDSRLTEANILMIFLFCYPLL